MIPLNKMLVTYPHYSNIRMQLPKIYALPVYGYLKDTIDWNIFSETIHDDFGTNDFENHCVVYYYNPAIWCEDRRLILRELDWLKNNVFTKLGDINEKTKKVLLGISESRIERSLLPDIYKAEMIEHMQACANVRFAVIRNYYYETVMRLPF